MRIQAIRNKKGETVATFETEKGGTLAPTVELSKGETVDVVEANHKYHLDPRTMYRGSKKA